MKPQRAFKNHNFVQILISPYHSTSVSEDRVIPSDVSPKIQKQVTLVEAYEY